MKFSFVILGALAFIGTASANVVCNTQCTKMKCFSAWCTQKGYVKTVTVTAKSAGDGGDAGGKGGTVTKTCTKTVTGDAAKTTEAAGGKGAEVKTVTVTAASPDDEPETVTKVVTKTCTKTVTKTVTANGGGGGYY
ncbi:hypothetical protein TWF281_000601 [Arthrobotrys megalospora]